jgi:NAD(P) transhydrogenase subunit alpha
VKALQLRGITSFAVELIPRISRAQSMDALSSQAAIAGYKAVLIAANNLQKFMPMLTTAAGTIRPSQVLIIGAGVAGLVQHAPHCRGRLS